jgi:hypothetical protein
MFGRCVPAPILTLLGIELSGGYRVAERHGLGRALDHRTIQAAIACARWILAADARMSPGAPRPILDAAAAAMPTVNREALKELA